MLEVRLAWYLNLIQERAQFSEICLNLYIRLDSFEFQVDGLLHFGIRLEFQKSKGDQRAWQCLDELISFDQDIKE